MEILHYNSLNTKGNNWYCFWYFGFGIPGKYLTHKGWERYDANWTMNNMKDIGKYLVLCKTEKEIEQRVRKHFEKHPKEFAEYIAQRMGVTSENTPY